MVRMVLGYNYLALGIFADAVAEPFIFVAPSAVALASVLSLTSLLVHLRPAADKDPGPGGRHKIHSQDDGDDLIPDDYPWSLKTSTLHLEGGEEDIG